MHLEQGQSLDECIDCFGRKLLPLTEHYVHALEESEKVFLLKNQMSLLFEEPLCDGIESVNEVLLINVESSAGKESIFYNRPNICYLGGEPWTNHDISGGWDLVTKL